MTNEKLEENGELNILLRLQFNSTKCIEHQLCVRHCTKYSGNTNEYVSIPALGMYNLVGGN